MLRMFRKSNLLGSNVNIAVRTSTSLNIERDDSAELEMESVTKHRSTILDVVVIQWNRGASTRSK